MKEEYTVQTRNRNGTSVPGPEEPEDQIPIPSAVLVPKGG